MIRVLVAHEQSLLRSALAALLDQEPDFEVAGADWHRVNESGRLLRPHVWVADADCPGWRRHVGGWTRPAEGHAPAGRTLSRAASGSGSAEVSLRAPEAASAADVMRCTAGLVVLTDAGKPGNLRRAYDARALGFVNKDRSPDRLPAAVRRAAEGKRFVDESLAVEFMQAAEMPLTRRELSVLSLSAEGASVNEIARSLRLGNGTVRNYLAAITRKTGARNRVDAIRISRVAGWV